MVGGGRNNLCGGFWVGGWGHYYNPPSCYYTAVLFVQLNIWAAYSPDWCIFSSDRSSLCYSVPLVTRKTHFLNFPPLSSVFLLLLLLFLLLVSFVVAYRQSFSGSFSYDNTQFKWTLVLTVESGDTLSLHSEVYCESHHIFWQIQGKFGFGKF